MPPLPSKLVRRYRPNRQGRGGTPSAPCAPKASGLCEVLSVGAVVGCSPGGAEGEGPGRLLPRVGSSVIGPLLFGWPAVRTNSPEGVFYPPSTSTGKEVIPRSRFHTRQPPSRG